MPRRVEQLKKQYPEADIEVWAFDEHRLWQLSDEPLVNRKFETLRGVGGTLSDPVCHSLSDA
ncbi:hypothetical protein [Leptodesmis sichuanensis]|uniref:hypothetical protein n=1 Tax=Leptodesmis sichuanensis TaxID=2906798 RepID=UPI001F380668|nr:hypothetical protein [Leptodesmis sichuanensis]UIE35957.1 hypothetical protein KIK02_12725 [Leptodesmis sichuanensis A121]